MLGVDVKVEDDGHEEVQQAEKEHGLADALQRHPQQPAHHAGGRRPIQWARASGCRPAQGQEGKRPAVRPGGAKPPTPVLPTARALRRAPSHLPAHTSAHLPSCIRPATSHTDTALGNSRLKRLHTTECLPTHMLSSSSSSTHTHTHTHTHTRTHSLTALTLRHMPLLHDFTPSHQGFPGTGHVTSAHRGSYLNTETHLHTDSRVFSPPQRTKAPQGGILSPGFTDWGWGTID